MMRAPFAFGAAVPRFVADTDGAAPTKKHGTENPKAAYRTWLFFGPDPERDFDLADLPALTSDEKNLAWIEGSSLVGPCPVAGI